MTTPLAAAPADAHETFRDALSSVHRDGRRKWVYARQPAGRYYQARTLVSVALLAFLVAAPFVSFRGQPLVLLNVLERRFVLFGLVFWPQDFHLVVLIALTAIVTLALSTATVGRVWCGWLCPQTVFMEMVFRRLEYWIDGPAERQVRRDALAVDAGRLGPRRRQARAVLRRLVRDRQPVPGLCHRRRTVVDDRHRSTGRGTSPAWPRSRCSACCSTASSPASANRPARSPARTDA